MMGGYGSASGTALSEDVWVDVDLSVDNSHKNTEVYYTENICHPNGIKTKPELYASD